MTEFRYKGKMASISQELLALFISASTKRAKITLSKSSLMPGETFNISWSFEWRSTQPLSYPAITTRILWKDHNYLIWEGPQPGLIWIPFNGKVVIAGMVAVNDSKVPDDFYKPGVRQIDLEVQWKGQDWNGPGSGTVTSSDWLTVTLDDPVGNWWEWTSDTWRPDIELDESYSLTGKITNRHRFAEAQAVTASLWKWEEGHEDDKKVVRSKMPDNLPLAPKESTPIDFGDFSDHWEWMDDCLVWTFEPSKRVRYQVELAVVDEFGNPYDDFAPLTSGVVAHVPTWTKEKKVASCAISIGGLVSKVIGLFSPAGVALLGGSYYLEDWLTKAAMNPVQPDADFKSKVTHPEIPFDPEDAAFGRGLEATRKFLKVALEIAVLDNMRSRIVGKIRGARGAGQSKDERSQRDAYSNILSELKAKVRTLQTLSDDADAELLKQLVGADIKIPDEIRLDRLHGIEKLPPGLADQLMDFLALPDLKGRVSDAQSFGNTAEVLSHAMSAIEEEDTKSLSGSKMTSRGRRPKAIVAE